MCPQRSTDPHEPAPRPDGPRPAALSTPDQWPDALAHLVETHRAGGRINYIGGPADSITEGVGATERSRGWFSLLAETMSRELGAPTRAIGSAEIAIDGVWPVWTASGPWPPRSTGRSLGRHGMFLLPYTVLSTTQGCDRFRLLIDDITEAFGFAGGTLEVRVDGQVVDAIDCGQFDTVGRMWDSGPLGDYRERTIELECVEGGFVAVGHSYFHDGTTGSTGPLFWRNAHNRYSAAKTTHGFGDPRSTWAGPLTRRRVSTNPVNQRPVFGGGAITPDCFLCCTATNDILLTNDRSQLTTTYIELVGYIRRACGPEPSIGFIVPTSSTNNGGDYEPVYEATLEACRSTGSFLIDVLHAVGTHADDRDGFYADGTHPNDRGHAAWADYVSSWLLEAVQGEVVDQEPDATAGWAG